MTEENDEWDGVYRMIVNEKLRGRVVSDEELQALYAGRETVKQKERAMVGTALSPMPTPEHLRVPPIGHPDWPDFQEDVTWKNSSRKSRRWLRIFTAVTSWIASRRWWGSSANSPSSSTRD